MQGSKAGSAKNAPAIIAWSRQVAPVRTGIGSGFAAKFLAQNLLQPCRMSIISTPPNTLAAKLLPATPPAVRTAGPEKSATAGFQQTLAAASPVDPGGVKESSAQIWNAGFSQTSAIPAQAVATKPATLLKNAESFQAAGAKRARKGFVQKPATAPPATQQSTTPLTAAALSILPKITVPVALAAAVPAAAAPELEPPKTGAASPQPAATAEIGFTKPGPAISTNDAKPHNLAEAPPKTAGTQPVSQNILTNIASTATTNTGSPAHIQGKTAEITKQIAAALPRGSLTNTGTTPALHISLTPETLGTITVKILQHASGETAITITASQPETLAALKHDAPNLNQILTNAGVAEADRQVNFQMVPVAAAQSSAGLGNAGGQPVGGQPVGGQPAGGQFAGGQLAGGQAGQGNASGQQHQAGTAFATSVPRPATAASATIALQPGSNRARSGVDVIA